MRGTRGKSEASVYNQITALHHDRTRAVAEMYTGVNLGLGSSFNVRGINTVALIHFISIPAVLTARRSLSAWLLCLDDFLSHPLLPLGPHTRESLDPWSVQLHIASLGPDPHTQPT